MVLVEDISSSSANDGSASNSSSSTAAPPPPPRNTSRASSSSSSLINVLLERKTDAVLLLSRLATVFFAILYLFQSFRPDQPGNVYYNKALLSSAVTSALRLRQRIPQFEMSRAFFFNLIREDSAHYLMYSFLFLTGPPMTLVLIPITTYAILHSCSFLAQILVDYPTIKSPLDRLIAHHPNVLRFVALNEIILMPLLVLSIFIGRSNLLLIFLYYRFLTLRYTSHRNPHTKYLFTELRHTVEYFCQRPSCPPFVARLCHTAISFINRLAPVTS